MSATTLRLRSGQALLSQTLSRAERKSERPLKQKKLEWVSLHLYSFRDAIS